MPIYTQSIFDKITTVTSDLKRKIMDHNIRLIGTKISLLRITKTKVNAYNDTEETVDSTLIHNVTLKYPLSETELFVSKRSGQMYSDAINLWDLLPIEMTQYYEGDIADTSSEIKADDILIDVLKDNKGNVIPIPMQVIRLVGTFEGKHLIRKKYELSLVRGTQNDVVQDAIDAYVGLPEIRSTLPDVEATSVARGVNLDVTFNISMDTTITEAAFSIVPVVSGVFSWDAGQKIMTFNPDSDLGSLTRYDIEINQTAKSTVGLVMKEIYSTYFTTIV